MPYHKYRRTDLRRYWVQARVRLGRRGVALSLVGLLYLTQPPLVIAGVFPEEYWLLNVATWPRAVAWLVAAVLAFVYAWRRRDWLGWAGLYVMGIYRAAAYLLGWADWLDDGHGGPGDPAGIAYGITWLITVALLMLIAGWADEVHNDTPREDQR